MTASILFALLALLSAGAPGGILLDRPLPVPCSDDKLQYDDGTANWLTWVGTYKGTWFHVGDFIPSPTSWYAENLEMWFYHHSSYPWDTASFYAELWNGGPAGPSTELDQTSISALHYAPVYADYNPWLIPTGMDFWGVVNAELSAGGWPSLLGDNSASSPSHSFYSYDFITWEPWLAGHPTASDYFIRCSGVGTSGLEEATWGSIKGLFQQ
jgi:hypothetical protein